MKKLYINTDNLKENLDSYIFNKEYCRHCGIEMKFLHAPLPCGHVICGYDCPKRAKCCNKSFK